MATRKKFKTPSSVVLCMTPEKPTQFQIMCMNAAIKRLRDLGVNTFSNTTEFDPEYPRLLWDRDGQLTQTKADESLYSNTVNSLEEFVALFEVPEVIVVKDISKDYNAEVFTDRIKVGCQTISVEKFKELISAAKEMGIID